MPAFYESSLWILQNLLLRNPDFHHRLLGSTYVPCYGHINYVGSNPSNFDAISIRIDQNITKKLTAFGRFMREPSNSTVFQTPNNGNYSASNIETMTVGLTWTISPSMVNEVRGNWSRNSGFQTTNDIAAYGAQVLPDSVLYPPGQGLTSANSQAYFSASYVGGIRKGSRVANPEAQWNFVDNFSKMVGTHQFKFGADYRRICAATRPASEYGVFASGTPASSFAQLYNGTFNVLLASNNIPIDAHINNISFYGQDTWRLNSRLTMTYGLRWDINTPPTSDTAGYPLYSVSGIFDTQPFGLTASHPLWNTQYDAIAPRLGVAYQLNEKTALRGGLGMFYDMGYSGQVSGVMGSYFPYSGMSFGFGHFPLDLSNTSVFKFPDFTTVPGPNSGSVVAVDPNLRLPITYQWNLAFERQLGNNQTFSATYVGNAANKLLTKSALYPPDSVYGLGTGFDVSANQNLFNSHYNALQLQYNRRAAKGLSAVISYTYSHANDQGSSDQLGWAAATARNVYIPPMSRSDFDIRQNFQAMASYQIPGADFAGKIGGFLTKGWAVDGIERLQSGPPLTVQVDMMVTPTLTLLAIPDRVPGQPIWIPDPSEPAGKALNPAAFAVPSSINSDSASSAYGTLGRNTIQSPYGVAQTDLALRRRFNITERVKLDLRMEYFNLFNHPMFGGTGYGTSIAPVSFLGYCYMFLGPCTADGSGWVSNAPDFGHVRSGVTMNTAGNYFGGGQASTFAAGGQRSGQFTVKLSF